MRIILSSIAIRLDRYEESRYGERQEFRDMKVYGLDRWGSQRCIVAAKSKTTAARLFGVSLHQMENYGGETGNGLEIETALSKPGVVFVAPLLKPNPVFVEEAGK